MKVEIIPFQVFALPDVGHVINESSGLVGAFQGEFSTLNLSAHRPSARGDIMCLNCHVENKYQVIKSHSTLCARVSKCVSPP